MESIHRKVRVVAGLKKRLPFVALVAAAVSFINLYVGSQLFWVGEGALLAILISLFTILAGFTVLKALFAVAAEISLMIFLAQSYCAVPQRPVASDSALKSLLAVGLLYIIGTFLQSLYKTFKESYPKIGSERSSTERTALVIFDLIFIAIFLWEIYLVMEPIIANLCVNR